MNRFSRRQFGALVAAWPLAARALAGEGQGRPGGESVKEAAPLKVIPLSRVFGQRYAVYWRVKQP